MRSSTFALLVVAVTVALAASAALAMPAGAVQGPIELVSKSDREQAAYATRPALSADGRYVAFCAEFGGHDGIYREELATGRLAPVLTGASEERFCRSETPHVSGPSISADGRYVSFTTTVALSALDTDDAPDVYVADMSTSPPTFELASTEDGSTPMDGGSTAAGRVALSADGSRVAFVHGGNVYVRDLPRQETTLISAAREALTGAMNQAKPVEGGGAYEPAGAAISADGSTVAWVGEHLPEEVPLPPGEEAAIRKLEAESKAYHEPLWRRVPTDASPAPPTRRVIGGEGGPYPEGGLVRGYEGVVSASGFGWGIQLPQLDADGDEVVLAGNPAEQYDLFVVEMAEGSGRAIDQVTTWTNPDPLSANVNLFGEPQFWPFTGEVADFAVSPDGAKIAFTTTRQRFATAPYALITELPSAVSLLSELYEVDLGTDKIERLTPGPGKDVSDAAREAQGATSPSFGVDGRLVAFASEAENLVAGDANEKSDVFTIESSPPAVTGQSTISTRPPQRALRSPWRMTANAYSRPDGSVRVTAVVPGSGALRATARAQLGAKLKSHRVAAGHRRSRAAGMLTFDLELGGRRRALARRPGLVTRVHVSFSGRGGRPLHADLESRFLVHRKKGRGDRGKGSAG